MNIAYYHDSKFGNGALVAEEFKKVMAARGVTVSVQHIRDANPKDLPKADLYVFSSPGRIGKPKGSARRFPAGAGVLTQPPGQGGGGG
jgi:hypothetical protein